MTPKETVETIIRPIAQKGFDDALEILQAIQLMEYQNKDSVNAKLSAAGAGRAAIVARNAFLSEILLLVVRCYAPVRNGDLHLRQAFELLANDAAVRAEVESKSSKQTVADAQRLWEKCCGDPRLKQIKHFRDKFTAHCGMPDPRIAIPKYDELFPFSIATTEVMERLAHAAGVNTHHLSDWSAELSGTAKEFWKPWHS